MSKQAIIKGTEEKQTAQVRLPDRHVLVDVVDISEHNFSWQHREGEGACEGSHTHFMLQM